MHIVNCNNAQALKLVKRYVSNPKVVGIRHDSEDNIYQVTLKQNGVESCWQYRPKHNNLCFGKIKRSDVRYDLYPLDSTVCPELNVAVDKVKSAIEKYQEDVESIYDIEDDNLSWFIPEILLFIVACLGIGMLGFAIFILCLL